MTIQAKLFCAVAVSGFAAFAATAPAQALTTQECSAKYQAAKTAGTLAGQKWNDFRKAQCADAAAAPAAAPLLRRRWRPSPLPRRKLRPQPPPRRRQDPQCSHPPWMQNTPRKPPARPGCIPASINTTPTRTSNGNGGMKWIEKGGGYYSECNKKLKG